MADKYWEREDPIEFRQQNMVLKHYPQAKKLQCFHWIESSRPDGYTGFSKGFTIDLAKFEVSELIDIKNFIAGAIDQAVRTVV